MALAHSPELEKLRERIDRLDDQILGTLGERFVCTRHIGRVKAALNLPAMDAAREHLHLEHLRARAIAQGLDADLVVRLFTEIMRAAVQEHRRIAQEGHTQQ